MFWNSFLFISQYIISSLQHVGCCQWRSCNRLMFWWRIPLREGMQMDSTWMLHPSKLLCSGFLTVVFRFWSVNCSPPPFPPLATPPNHRRGHTSITLNQVHLYLSTEHPKSRTVPFLHSVFILEVFIILSDLPGVSSPLWFWGVLGWGCFSFFHLVHRPVFHSFFLHRTSRPNKGGPSRPESPMPPFDP